MRIVPVAVFIVGALALSFATEAAPPGSTQPPTLSSVTKVLTIEPRKSDLGPYMCQGLRLLSATVATQRGQSIPLIYLDDKQKEVAKDKWAPVSGFKLTRKPDQVLDVVMVCGP